MALIVSVGKEHKGSTGRMHAISPLFMKTVEMAKVEEMSEPELINMLIAFPQAWWYKHQTKNLKGRIFLPHQIWIKSE